MYYHQRPFASIVNRQQMKVFFVLLGAYGHAGPKGSILCSNWRLCPALAKPLTGEQLEAFKTNPDSTHTEWVDGQRKVYGNKDCLKEGQEYPQAFAEEIVKLYEDGKEEESAMTEEYYNAEDSESDYEDLPRDEWRDAKLNDFKESLQAVWSQHGHGDWPGM